MAEEAKKEEKVKKLSLAERKKNLESKFKEKNYILLEFVCNNVKGGEDKELGLIDIDSGCDLESVFKNLVVRGSHKVVGANLPGLELPEGERPSKVVEAKLLVDTMLSGAKVADPKAAEAKTKAMVEEVTKRLEAEKAQIASDAAAEKAKQKEAVKEIEAKKDAEIQALNEELRKAKGGK